MIIKKINVLKFALLNTFICSFFMFIIIFAYYISLYNLNKQFVMMPEYSQGASELFYPQFGLVNILGIIIIFIIIFFLVGLILGFLINLILKIMKGMPFEIIEDEVVSKTNQPEYTPSQNQQRYVKENYQEPK